MLQVIKVAAVVTWRGKLREIKKIARLGQLLATVVGKCSIVPKNHK